MRIENNKLPVKAYNQRSGYKAKGRPRVRLIDNIKDINKNHGFSTAMAIQLALERKLKLKLLHSMACMALTSSTQGRKKNNKDTMA
jgi:hypothetical protein